MAQDYTICVGTVGAGVWYSRDSGETWKRSRMHVPFEDQPGEIQIRALAVAPHDANRLYAGSEVGLYTSADTGRTWDLIESPMAGTQIWSVAVHPEHPQEIWAGTKPPAVYRTTDGGATWHQVPLTTAAACLAGAPKVTNIVFDPRDARTIWVGVEIDGVYRSTDGGATWEHLPAMGDKPLNQDVHGLTISLGEQPKIVVTTPDGIWHSTDEGQTWSLHSFPRFFDHDTISYCRGVALKPGNPEVIFVGNGDFIPGRIGAIQRSTDGGETWEAAALPVVPNSTIYWFGTNPADADFIVANSLNGYVYTSRNGGDSWQKVAREFGEIRAVTWIPNTSS
jgi:hypothetical protein